MPEKPGTAKGRPEKETNRKGFVAGDTPGTAYEVATEITTPGTRAAGAVRDAPGAGRGKEQKKPATEE
ncbi:MAG: hypothetical protein H5T99_04445 [Moorella sp. (in: Bacteria)]|nr:hypothetical protein [Moorella sp. (in: firmicutes)]